MTSTPPKGGVETLGEQLADAVALETLVESTIDRGTVETPIELTTDGSADPPS